MTTPSLSGAGARTGRGPTAANLPGLDYRAEAVGLGTPPVPVIDAHTHINGPRAAEIWAEVCDLYGIERTFSQTHIGQAAAVRSVLGERISYIAVPSYMAEDKAHAFTHGFLEDLDRWHGEFGARCVKLWNAPRWRDICEQHLVPAGIDLDQILALDSPWRLRIAERASELGMMIMVHVADPDTWFQTRYADPSRYGTKAEHHEALERLVQRFDGPFLIAHMGGSPEDLDYLDGLLTRHPSVHLDTSATKWMVRELGRQPRDRLVAFVRRWAGRILFGSDIVTSDDHLRPTPEGEAAFGVHLSDSPEGAFELYASRYWALRTMWETAYDGTSNIADPDLKMVDPDRFGDLDAPRLRGVSLDADDLRVLYRDAAHGLLVRRYDA